MEIEVAKKNEEENRPQRIYRVGRKAIKDTLKS
jgi:hypothetical protein